MDLNLDGGHLATAGGAGLVGALAPKLLGWAHKLFSRRLKDEREQGVLATKVANLEAGQERIEGKVDRIIDHLLGSRD